MPSENTSATGAGSLNYAERRTIKHATLTALADFSAAGSAAVYFVTDKVRGRLQVAVKVEFGGFGGVVYVVATDGGLVQWFADFARAMAAVVRIAPSTDFAAWAFFVDGAAMPGRRVPADLVAAAREERARLDAVEIPQAIAALDSVVAKIGLAYQKPYSEKVAAEIAGLVDRAACLDGQRAALMARRDLLAGV